VDLADIGVRGKGKAKVVDDDSEYAVKILTQTLMRYVRYIDSPEAKSRIEIAKKYYSIIEITPFTWRLGRSKGDVSLSQIFALMDLNMCARNKIVKIQTIWKRD
jgi:hypothetical protein